MMVIVGGGAGTLLVVLIVIAFILCRRRPTSGDSSSKEKGGGEGVHSATTILQQVNGSADKKSPISLKSSVVLTNENYPNSLQSPHPLQPPPPCFINAGDNDSDTKEIDNRTASSLSAGEADSTGCWENDRDSSPRGLISQHKYLTHSSYTPTVSLN